MLVAAALRFPTLGRQSFSEDEIWTVWLVRMNLGDMLHKIPQTESTPPAYYVLAHFWGRAFGTDEFALRTLSALVGTATVAVAFEAARALVSQRAAIVAGALLAVNPFLIYYSQDARSYALLGLLGAVSFLCFVHALRTPTPRWLAGWAAASALALATHYFAGFLVLPEAVWLLTATRGRRSVAATVGLPALSALAVMPVAIDQIRNGNTGRGSDLAVRVAQIPKQFVLGARVPAELEVTAVTAVLVLVAIWLLASGVARADFAGVKIAAVTAAATVGLPVILAVVGLDWIDAKSLLTAIVPGAIVLGAGFAASRAGVLAAGGLLAVSLVVGQAPAVDLRYGRSDWRGVARALGCPTGRRAIVGFVGSGLPRGPFTVYLRGVRVATRLPVSVDEIAAVASATLDHFVLGTPEPPRLRSPAQAAPRGFRLAVRSERPTYSLYLYRSPAPRRVSMRAFRRLAVEPEASPTPPAEILLQDHWTCTRR